MKLETPEEMAERLAIAEALEQEAKDQVADTYHWSAREALKHFAARLRGAP